MLTSFKTASNRDLIEELLTDKVTISHEYGDSFAKDIIESISELLEEYDDMKHEYNRISEMERHNAKLEAMLDRRKVRYKKWEE